MGSEQLTALLAERVMGWTAAPDRFLMGGRRWAPRWRFQPLRKLEHAFQLLEKSGSTYTLTFAGDGSFVAEVHVGNRTGIASAKLKPEAITLAVAQAIGLRVDNECLEGVDL